MKSRSFLTLLLIISLAVVPSVQLALAASTSSSSSSSSSTTAALPATPFSERADIYTAGANSFWLVTLSPVNSTLSQVASVESVAGVSAYQVMAVQGSTAQASSQLFWPGAYNILHVPFMPYSGVFLNVTATSQSAAETVASDFATLFGSNLTQLSSGGGNFTFYGPESFGIAGADIYSSVPATFGGLAGITTESGLAGDPTPTAILTGVKNGTSFVHSVRFGSAQTGAIGTNNSLLLEDAMNLANDSFTSSPRATSTQVVVHALNGLIKSSDNATIRNTAANFSGTYSFTVPPDRRFRPNMTINSNPPVLLATRTVDSGSISSGGRVTVTLNFRNTAINGTINNVYVNDSWWKSYPSLFSLSVGNSSFTVPSLAPEANFSRSYVLSLNSSASDDIVVPSVKATYQFAAGSLTVNPTAYTNQLELRVNDPGPALEVTAGSDIESGAALGKVGNWVITATNAGSDSALNLNVLNYTDPTLIPGGTWTVKVPLPVTSIADINLTQSFKLGWTTPAGTTGTLATNPASLLLSFSNIQVPVVQFKLTATTTAVGLASGTINATYQLSNKGAVTADNITIAQAFPQGMACKRVVAGNGTCSSSGFSEDISSLASFATYNGTLLLTFGRGNYITPPATVTATTSQGILSLKTQGSVLPVAAAISVAKSFSPSAVFVGQESNATVSVSNQGSLPVYNASLSTISDPFDTSVSGTLNKAYPVLSTNTSDSFDYTVRMLSPGNHTSTSTTLSYIFGGYSVSYPVNSGTVVVYKPLVGTTLPPSSAREGSDFSVAFVVQNQSPQNVSNVSASFKIPAGLVVVSHPSGFQVQGHTLTLSLSSLSAGATSNSSVTLRADFDGTFSLGSPTLTFQYLGATIPGTISSPSIAVGVDALLRYELPIGLAILLTLGVAFYMHRKPVTQAK